MTLRGILFALPLLLASFVHAQTPAKPASLRSVLLAQLRSTHNHAEWFTPVNAAIAGLTPEQARWIPTNNAGKLDPNANHSSGMLAYHLLYWNRRALMQLRGEKPPAFDGDNTETFNHFDAATWNDTVKGLDKVLTDLEDFTGHCSDEQLQKSAETLAHIATHNAYHTGQILYVRKLQGSWNPDNGVK